MQIMLLNLRAIILEKPIRLAHIEYAKKWKTKIIKRGIETRKQTKPYPDIV